MKSDIFFKYFGIFAATVLTALSAGPLAAQSPAAVASVDSGDTAWIITASVLVLMMTVPGLAFFYGGLVRQKNVLSIAMQCLVITAAVSIEWVVLGYSWVFGSNLSGTVAGSFVGGFEKMFLSGISLDAVNPFGGNIPELGFVMFQCMFAVITPALIIGAFAERIKFSGFLLFSLLWAMLVYNTTAHWVWGGGWMHRIGVIDFAGGTVVHVNAGVSALVMAIMLRRRRDYANGHPIPPHNIPFVVMGTALLWLGWFGFNAGSGLAADGLAANALVVTHLAAAMAAIAWAAIEWIVYRRPTVVGICTGAVAGLVAITPAAGSVDPFGALVIGAVSACVCYMFVARLKPRFRYDDSLDAFGVHGVGGFTGAVLAGVFATQFVTGEGNASGALYGDWHQLWIQVLANLAAAAFSAVVTFVLFKLVDKTVGLRVGKNDEDLGLDVSQHGEIAYDR